MDHSTHNKIVSFIWSIADDCLRDVILPMFVLRRLDCLLELTKDAITCGELQKVSVVLAPLDEQRATLAHVKDQIGRIEQSLASVQSQIASLYELKSIVIADVVSGRMRI